MILKGNCPVGRPVSAAVRESPLSPDSCSGGASLLFWPYTRLDIWRFFFPVGITLKFIIGFNW